MMGGWGAWLAVAVLLLGAAGCGPQAPPTVETVQQAPATSPTVAAAPASAAPYAGPPLVDHVTWSSDRRGRMLRVYPSDAGRTTSGDPARTGAWLEVVRAAPTADTASMRDQFYCHWDFARIVEPGKASWNLEEWRPDVGYAATVQAECNPGGAE